MAQNIERELNDQLRQLPSDQQRKVLDFARSLAVASGNGSSGQGLLNHAGAIEPDDLAAIKQAIEEGCESINSDEW